jgi:hypothetical protein
MGVLALKGTGPKTSVRTEEQDGAQLLTVERTIRKSLTLSLEE